MKPLSERPAESRKPWTRFYGITAKESGLLLLKTDTSTRIPRITSNDGLSLPCSSSVLMNMMHKYLFLRATSQVVACRHLATAARVKYPAALQRCKFDTPLLAAGSLISFCLNKCIIMVNRNCATKQ